MIVMNGLTLVLVRIVIGLTVGFSIYTLAIRKLMPRKVRADEIHFADTKDGWRIRLCRYLPKGDEASREPVLVVHGANANQWNMTAPADESLVDLLTKSGFDCWCIDLRGCRSSKPPKGTSRFSAKIDDYIRQDLPAAIAYVLRTADRERLHWVGHSMGGMMLYAYVLAHGDRYVATGSTIGSPVGFSEDPGLTKLEPVLKLARLFPRLVEFVWQTSAPFCPAFKLNLPFAPVSWPNMHRNAGPEVFFNVAELLPPDAANHFMEWARGKGPWKMLNGTLNVEAGLKSLAFPLLVVAGKGDPLTPIKKIEAFYEALPGKDKRLVIVSRANGNVADYNHLDLVWGRDATKDVFRPVAAWLAAHPFDGEPQVELVERPQ